jgi:hypothetical protein
MKIYGIDQSFRDEFVLVEANVTRETNQFYWIDARSSAWGYSVRVPKLDAHLTPEAAWKHKAKRLMSIVESAKQSVVNKERELARFAAAHEAWRCEQIKPEHFFI